MSRIADAEIDGKAVPKVIDFGVAKALHQKLTDQTVYTEFAHVLGTPLYMSPEQAGLGALDIDTRSDVYSLGVVLYELLTGETPLDRDQLKKVTLDEMRRVIREDEPKRPSAMVNTLAAEAQSTVAVHRSVHTRKLSQTLAGELDWIVMKSLEKDRNRRYDSATALAQDIQRYLDDEPVLACPPSVVYRLGKSARRHKGILTTASVVLVSLLVGISIASSQALRTGAAEQVAEQERDEAEKSLQAD